MGLWILSKVKILMKNNHKIQFNMFLILISGILFNLAYPPFNIYIFAYVGLIPIFYVMLDDRKISNSFLYGALWAISFYGIFLYWIKIFHILALPAVIFALGIYYGILLWVTKLLVTRFKKLSYIIVPAVWVSIEYIRSIGFLGFPGGWFFILNGILQALFKFLQFSAGGLFLI